MERLKIHILCLVLVCCYSTSSAFRISEHDVAEMALIHFRQQAETPENNSAKAYTINKRDLNISTISLLGKSPLYVVNYRDGGWALIASDSKVKPILAYSNSETFPAIDDMPPGMKWLFSQYENIVEMAAKDSLATAKHSGWNVLNENNSQRNNRASSPVILDRIRDVKWGQGSGNDGSCNRQYNLYCPTYYTTQCGHTVTGCAATALGQILWYYQWPGYANVPDTIIPNFSLKISSWPDPLTTRDAYYYYNQMPTALYKDSTALQEHAIASLLRDCGYSVKMYYGPNSSSAFPYNVPSALKRFFSYSQSATHIIKGNNNASDSIMTITLKNEIDNGRPVFYYGYSPRDNQGNRSGHAFVVYGYENDYFNINWGFNGNYSEALYSIASLHIPNTIHDYSYDQGAIIGIEPDYCAPQKINPSDIWATNFTKAYTGNIDIGNRTIPSNAVGSITASNSIHLSHGFRILPGAKVSITIDGTPCEAIGNNRQHTPERIQQKHNVENGNKLHDNTDRFYLSPNPVASMLHIQTQDELSQAKIYTINGQCVLQASQADIDVSALPQGMYILRAETTDGTPLQAKFIKQ